MFKTLAACLSLFCITTGSQTPGQPRPATTQVQANSQTQQPEIEVDQRRQLEEAIKRVLVSQVEAWNHGNLQDYMKGYWHSPDLTFFSGGTVTKGWEPTLLRYQQRYQGEGKEMGKLDFQDLNIDLLSRRAAVVTGKWHLSMSDGKQPRGLFTLIVKRIDDGWHIVHDHTSVAE